MTPIDPHLAWYPVHPHEFQDLTLGARLLYQRLCDHYVVHGPIPADAGVIVSLGRGDVAAHWAEISTRFQVHDEHLHLAWMDDHLAAHRRFWAVGEPTTITEENA